MFQYFSTYLHQYPRKLLSQYISFFSKAAARRVSLFLRVVFIKQSLELDGGMGAVISQTPTHLRLHNLTTLTLSLTLFLCLWIAQSLSLSSCNFTVSFQFGSIRTCNCLNKKNNSLLGNEKKGFRSASFKQPLVLRPSSKFTVFLFVLNYNG